LLVVVWLNPLSPFIAVNGFGRNSYLNWLMLAALGLTAYYRNWLIPIASLVAVSALTYAFHRLGWSRAPFNDLRNKKSAKTREFFKRYCAAFKEVFSEIYSPNKGQAALLVKEDQAVFLQSSFASPAREPRDLAQPKV